MHSTPNLRDTDPHDVFVIEPDVSLAVRADKAPLDLLYDVLSNPSAPRPPNPEVRIAPDFSPLSPERIDPVFDTTVADDADIDDVKIDKTEIGEHLAPTSRFARRAFMGLFALCSAMAAAAWQHYGDDATKVIAGLTSQFTFASSRPAEKATTATTPALAAAAPDPAAQPAPAASAADSATAATSADSAQLQSMARDLAAMGQQIEQLKATVSELKATQTQPSREAAQPRLIEPLPKPKLAPPVRAAAAPVHRPKPAYAQTYSATPLAATPASQTSAAPPPLQIAPQATTADDGAPVVRPPMPLR